MEDTGSQAGELARCALSRQRQNNHWSLAEMTRTVYTNHVQGRGNGTGTSQHTGYEMKGTRHTKDKEPGIQESLS